MFFIRVEAKFYFFSFKMRLADRKLLIDRMDKQFQKDLEMRKKNNIVNKQALGTVATLNLLQKVL